MARIYVSSTFSDLKEYRNKVGIALRRLGHEDVAMEYYVAEDKPPLERCLIGTDPYFLVDTFKHISRYNDKIKWICGRIQQMVLALKNVDHKFHLNDLFACP